MSKNCEKCNKKIPEEYQNLLCDECYFKVEQEQAKKKEEEIAQVKKNPDSPLNQTTTQLPIGDKEAAPKENNNSNNNDFGIKDKNYVENPEMDDKDQVLANIAQFVYSHDPEKKRGGKLLWYPTRNMYTFIKNYCIKKVTSHPQYPKYIWKPKIVDIGCGSGVGSNILSQEADMVWGIDKNEFSIEFAKEAFTREKNGIYYSSQLTFDVIDIMKENRELMNFDIVVAIEIIEHIYDSHTFLQQLIHKFTKKDKKGNYLTEGGTEFFISTPNRNSHKIRKDKPDNIFHVREWTGQEFHELLSQYFKEVLFKNNKGEDIEADCVDDIILAHCKYPKL